MSVYCRLPVYILFAALVCIRPLLAAEPVKPGPGEASFNLGPHVEVLEDPEGQLTIDEVSGSFADRFQPSAHENPSFGFTRSVIWLRFTLDLSESAGHPWYLVQRHPIIDHIYLFRPDGKGGFTREHLGDALPFGERYLAHREFIFPLRADGEWPRTYYLKVQGKGALSLELRLASDQGLIERTYAEQLLFGLFYGALLIMLVYNSILFVTVRHRAYFWYVFFLGFFTLTFLNINGLGLQYLWPDLPVMNEHYALFASLAMLGLAQYSRRFLDLGERFPVYDRVLRGVFLFSVAITVAVLIVPPPWSYHLSTLLVVSEVSILGLVGWRAWRRGYRVARLYVLAWSAFLVGCVIFAMDNLQLIPHTMWSNYAPHVGSLWAVILLSLALADRIRLLEAERDAMTRRARRTLEQHVRDVERLDRDKMVFLEYLSHELNTPLSWLGNVSRLESADLPEDVLEAAEMVRKGQGRLMELVATSLRYFDLAARPVAPSLAHCRPAEQLATLVAERHRDLQEARLEVDNRIPPQLTVIACDHELEEVLGMVLDNAIQFSPDGGRIEADARENRDEREAVIRISDPGVGLERDQLQTIFEPFFMVGSAHRPEGFGLSLPMARQMIQQMGGVIWAESDGPGRGMSVLIRLPLAAY